MSKKLQLKIVTPEKLILEEEVESVTVPTTEGEITILADHIPLVAGLASGDIVARKDGEEISKEDMYETYVEYCKEKNLSTQTIKMLGMKLPGYVQFIADGLIDGINSKGKQDRVRGWKNVKIRGEETAKVEEIKKDEGDFGVFND